MNETNDATRPLAPARAGTLVAIDGEVMALDEARVPVTDRGFLYGDSVFETFRSYGRRAHALDRHLARLERSAAALEWLRSRGVRLEAVTTRPVRVILINFGRCSPARDGYFK